MSNKSMFYRVLKVLFLDLFWFHFLVLSLFTNDKVFSIQDNTVAI